MSIFTRLGRWGASLFSAPARVEIRRRAPKDRTRWPQWLSSGLTLDRLSSILHNADQGYVTDYYQLLQEIAGREGLLSGLLSVRLSALSQRPIKVEASTADNNLERAQSVADYCQRILDRIRLVRRVGDRVEFYGGLAAVVERITLACYYGISISWIHWDYRDGFEVAIPVALEPFDERRLYWDITTDEIHISSVEDPSRGSGVGSFDKSMILSARQSRLSPTLSMAGFARAILLPWWLRSGSFKDLLNYMETWGRPSIVGKQSKDAPGLYGEDQLEKFKNMLEDFLGDSRNLLPPGFDLEIIQAVLGGEKVFDLVDKMTERHIQFAAVGQVGAIAGDATTYASSSQAQKVRDDLTDGDSKFVSEALENLLSSAVSVRFGVGTPPPKVTFELEKSTDAIKARALSIQAASYPLTAMLKAGIHIDIVSYCKNMNIPLTDDGNIDLKWLENVKKVSDVIGRDSSSEPAS